MKNRQEEAGAAVPLAALFKSLSDPHRLTIVTHLMSGEHRVADLVGHLGLAQSTVSAHVACLRDCGILEARAEGRATYYSLADPEQVRQLLSAAGPLVADGAATTCPTNQAGGVA